MLYCTHCGAELVEGTAFCPICGAGQVQAVRPPEPAADTEPAYRNQAQPQPYQQPVYQQPAYQQPVYPQTVSQQNYQMPATTLTGAAKILSIISMVCGLLSLVSSFGGFTPGIAALVLSSIAKKKAPGVPNAMAKTGKITGIIGIILSTILLIAYIVYVVGLLTYMDESFAAVTDPYQYM